MGYDMRFSIFKKSLIQNALDDLKISELTDETFNYIFNHYLYAFLYPEDYEIPKEMEGRYIYDCSHPVLKGILDAPNNFAIMINEELYSNVCIKIEKKLKETRLIDLINLDEYESMKMTRLIELYKAMMNAHIDWSSEVVVFDHDW